MKLYQLFVKVIVVILIVVPINSFSQGKWTYFTKKDGLISNKIYKSFADQRGNVWFISHKGMSRFDGIEWFSDNDFFRSAGKFHVFEDNKGNIWFWLNYGSYSLAMFDGSNFSFPSEKMGLKCCVIQDITEDSKGRIWIVGSCGGFSKGRIDVFDGERYHNYSIKGGITNLYKDTKGNMWITTEVNKSTISTSYTSVTTGLISKCNRDTLLEFDSNGFLVNTSSGLPSTTIVFEDSNGNIWFNGLYGSTAGFIKLEHSAVIQINEQNWKCHEIDMGKIYRFIEDFENNIWAFSKRGTYIFDGTQWKLAWGMGKINSVAKDDNAAIWIGMDLGIGKYENGKWKYFTSNDGFGGVNVIFKDSKGNIWFGGENVYLFKNDKWVMENGKPDLIKFSDVTNIIEDKEGNIWISTKKNGVVKYTE